MIEGDNGLDGDKPEDEDKPKHETIHPKGVFWAPENKEQECDYCGNAWPDTEMVWIEPNNYGFAGWSEGQLLCPDCYMDWSDGSIAL
jgi:hypothetical protein